MSPLKQTFPVAYWNVCFGGDIWWPFFRRLSSPQGWLWLYSGSSFPCILPPPFFSCPTSSSVWFAICFWSWQFLFLLTCASLALFVPFCYFLWVLFVAFASFKNLLRVSYASVWLFFLHLQFISSFRLWVLYLLHYIYKHLPGRLIH